MNRSECDLGLHVGDMHELLMPRRVVHGDGSVAAVARVLRESGYRPGQALVVCDRAVAELRLYDDLVKYLADDGWDVTIYDEVEGEPTVARADHLAQSALVLRPDLVLGIGGGSAMDLAKVAALCVGNGCTMGSLGVGASIEAAVPLVLVPTTTGTGAEATAVAVLTGPDGKRVIRHESLVPMATVLDALLVVGLPSAITAATGMDALAHAAESWMSTLSSPLSAHASLRAAELLVEWLPRAFSDPGNLEARRATLYGAFLAGVGLNAGVVLGHSMAYTVTNRAPVSHGVSCAMALPFCVRFNESSVSKDASPLALALTGGRREDLYAAADFVRSFADSLGMPSSPSEVGISVGQAPEMARECASTYHRPSNPAPMTEVSLLPLYEAWFRDELAVVGGPDVGHP